MSYDRTQVLRGPVRPTVAYLRPVGGIVDVWMERTGRLGPGLLGGVSKDTRYGI